MSTAEHFLELYNRADGLLRKRAAIEDDSVRFNDVLQVLAFDPLVKPNRTRLKAYGRLRNAIVHDVRYPSGSPIADPRTAEVERLEGIVAELAAPTRLCDVGLIRPTPYARDDVLLPVVAEMLDCDFSQVLVMTASHCQLLSATAITRWLTADGNSARMATAHLSDVLACETGQSFGLASSADEVYGLQEKFESGVGEMRLQALLVTGNGTSSGIPVGLITAWDLLTQPIVRLLRDGYSDLGA